MMAIYVYMKHVALFTCKIKLCTDCDPASFLYVCLINIRHHNTKFSHPDDMAPGMFRLHINQERTRYMIVERKNSLKKNKKGHLKIKITNMKEWKILNI